MNKFTWTTTSPITDNVVVLKESTFHKHLIDDHGEKERVYLEKVVNIVRDTISSPWYIYYDRNYEENKRLLYMDIISLEEMDHMQALVVCIETDRDPQEVVTWTIKRSLKQERGKIIYDSKKHK
ncbi:MAG: hypothetical protein CVU87_02760 [Firmicutes bacterium HGW-Firmicutes-12]|jgi:hypothetical protein|nr:MAG: hypothetical protein CVU87_02760 [Firmicutes bacterium HGW-Firmicutes-12]